MLFLSDLPQLTQGAIVCIALLFVYFLFGNAAKTAAYAPTILTTCGIFATFVGIALGLKDFNPEQVATSLPELLNGLKTAFWASVFGVGGALLLKFRYLIIDLGSRAGHPAGPVSVEDIVLRLAAIEDAIVGEKPVSLVSQLKLARQDSNERLDALKDAQIAALHRLSELGTRALVEALQKTIRDFNTNLTGQFGENFKELNAAVHKLAVWQEQYKDHVESTTQRLQEVVQCSAGITADYSKFVEKSKAFAQVAADMGTLLAALTEGEKRLAETCQALAELLRSASGSLPDVERKVTQLTSQLAAAVEHNSAKIGEAVKTAAEELKVANEEQNRVLSLSVAQTKQQAETLNKSLEESLDMSLNSLGKHLAALSEKFVKDYEPLVEQLHEIVSIAGRVNA
jgi:hypothetical protein